jgi:hypothetical protein
MSNTPQGGAIEGNAADDALMVDQGDLWSLSWLLIHGKQVCQVVLILRSVFGYPSGRKPSEAISKPLLSPFCGLLSKSA